MKNILELNTLPEEYGAARAAEASHLVENHSEMHRAERAFVTGLLMQYQPKKILELGVSAGGGSVIILNAIKDMPDAKLYSVDLFENYYRDKSKPSGWMVDEFVPELKSKWTAYLGKDAVQVMDDITSTSPGIPPVQVIDFVVLDTAHIHPVETINFLCALPYLRDGAVVVLHDISLHLTKGGYATASDACRLLFDCVVADKITPKEKYANFPNIGAFQVGPDTRKYVYNMFSSLYLPWAKLYAKPWWELVPKQLIGEYAQAFERYYGAEYKEMFLGAVEAQDELYKNISFVSYIQILCGQFIRAVVKLGRT